MSEKEEPAGPFHRDTTRAPGRSAPQTGTPSEGGVEIGVRREGRLVQVLLTSESEYASIELYERLVHSIKNGSLDLKLGSFTPN